MSTRRLGWVSVVACVALMATGLVACSGAEAEDEAGDTSGAATMNGPTKGPAARFVYSKNLPGEGTAHFCLVHQKSDGIIKLSRCVETPQAASELDTWQVSKGLSTPDQVFTIGSGGAFQQLYVDITTTPHRLHLGKPYRYLALVDAERRGGLDPDALAAQREEARHFRPVTAFGGGLQFDGDREDGLVSRLDLAEPGYSGPGDVVTLANNALDFHLRVADAPTARFSLQTEGVPSSLAKECRADSECGGDTVCHSEGASHCKAQCYRPHRMATMSDMVACVTACDEDPSSRTGYCAAPSSLRDRCLAGDAAVFACVGGGAPGTAGVMACSDTTRIAAPCGAAEACRSGTYFVEAASASAAASRMCVPASNRPVGGESDI